MAGVLETVGVVGAGTMGAGIAQVALEAGHGVLLFDASTEAVELASARIESGLQRRTARQARPSDWVAACMGRLAVAPAIEELAAAAGVIIEAAVEELAAKRAIFGALDAAALPDAILATNTSALSVAAIARATHRPERVIGLHFFNPAPVMALVEVVVAPSTDPAVADRATILMADWGKTPVRCADSPGFIVNRVNRPFTIEALRMVEAGEADCVSVDAAIRAAGFPMGPFELMDLIGLDVNLAAARSVWEGLGRPDRLRPSEIQEALVAAGHLGRKSSRGFYRYDEAGRRLGPPDPGGPAEPASAPPGAGLDGPAIVGRIRQAIAAEARLAEDAGVATAGDIRLALRLGAGHPDEGPPRTIAT